MENNDNPADISTIRKMYIDPSKFIDSLGKGMYLFQINDNTFVGFFFQKILTNLTYFFKLKKNS